MSEWLEIETPGVYSRGERGGEGKREANNRREKKEVDKEEIRPDGEAVGGSVLGLYRVRGIFGRDREKYGDRL